MHVCAYFLLPSLPRTHVFQSLKFELNPALIIAPASSDLNWLYRLRLPVSPNTRMDSAHRRSSAPKETIYILFSLEMLMHTK